MANEPSTAPTASEPLRPAQVYAMAAICLAVGLAIGYLIPGSQPAAGPVQSAGTAASPSSRGSAPGGAEPAGKPTSAAAVAGSASPHGSAMGGGRMPTMAEMKNMADKQAAPLLEKLKSDPNNAAVLMQIGAIYHTTHQFNEAAVYYGNAVQVAPSNVPLRTKLAASLYRAGDVDASIAQLNQALTYDPKDANALFDLGTIKLQGKQDGKGAVAAWQKLLKTNPQLSAERKATVQKLMADVLTTLSDERRTEGVRQ